MARRFSTFVGIDLGGGRGKTTAVARLEADPANYRGGARVVEVMPRASSPSAPAPAPAPLERWHDEALLALVAQLPDDTVIAVDAPLTVPACVRCTLTECPGQSACADPATRWLESVGSQLVRAAAAADRDRIAAVPAGKPLTGRVTNVGSRPRALLSPYSHRCTAVHLHYARNVETRETLGQCGSPVTARAAYLRRAFAARGYQLNRNLIEVSPRATVHALFGERRARHYKREADPWQTRATIVEELSSTLEFAAGSRLSREEVLRNDHCFDAVLSAYTAFLWARDDWRMPTEHRDVFEADGWIWTPPVTSADQ